MNKFVYACAKLLIGLYINTIALFNSRLGAKVALALFMKPRGKKLQIHQEKYLKIARKESIQVEENNITIYHWPGDGPSLLLAHGWESHSYRWKAYISSLGTMGFDIFAIDAPGHGLSGGTKFTPLDYANAIDKVVLKYDVQFLIGHSVGAFTSIIYLSSYSSAQQLQYVVLKAPTTSLRKTTEQFFDMLYLNSKVRKAYMKLFHELTGKDIDYYDAVQLIKANPVKGLLIHDKQDTILDVKDSRRIIENWPNGEYIETDGYGHRLNKAEIIKIITEKLRPFV